MEAAAEVRARVQESFDRQGLMEHLGARVSYIGAGEVRIELPSRPEVTQQHGYFHAGATSSIADSAGGYAAFTLFPAGTTVLTVEFKINLLAPAEGERLEAVGTVIKPAHADNLQTRGVRGRGDPADPGRRRPADPDPGRSPTRALKTSGTENPSSSQRRVRPPPPFRRYDGAHRSTCWRRPKENGSKQSAR
jgi:uncharacterized protein (TIGR00369 family)